MAAVVLVRALREEEGLLPCGRKGLAVNMIADRVSVQGVMASCLAEIRAVADADITVRQVREDWASRAAAEDAQELLDEEGGESLALVGRVDRLVSTAAMVRIKYGGTAVRYAVVLQVFGEEIL